MAMTVTATMSGTAANQHIYLWIRVYTQAAEAGGASAAGLNASGGTGVTASLTPNFTGSLPLFAVTADNWGGTYTAAASNTIDSSSADADTWGAGFGRYTGTVTAATPLTFGASGVGGSCDYSTWACYELPGSGGSPVLDGSSPALASATGAGIKTVTSASFTPPAGSVVVAMVCGGGTGSSGSFAVAITNTGGLSFTQRAGTATVADQDTFVFTATAGGAAAAPAASPARPGRTWMRRFRHRQQLPPPPPVIPPVTATAAGAGAVTATVTQIATGAAAGAGSVTASAGKACIAGLGGTGAGYFADQYASPRFVLGDAAWGLCGNAGRWNSGAWQTDYDTFFANRAAQGFTVIYLKPMGTTQNLGINDDGRTFDPLWPFQGGTPSTGVSGANPSSGLTASYWARIDYMFASAQARGITIFLNAIGYNSDFNGGPGPLAGKSTTEFTAYGTALGGRYKNQVNLVWNLSDDYFGGTTPDSLITAFMTGVRGAGDTHAVAIENMPESDSRKGFARTETCGTTNLSATVTDTSIAASDVGARVTGSGIPAGTVINSVTPGTSFVMNNQATATASVSLTLLDYGLPWGTANAQFNFTYSYNVTYYGIERAYLESSPLTVIQGDGYFYQGNNVYQGGTGAFGYDRAIRQDAWHAISSGARGIIHGSESIWQYQSTALASSSTDWYYVNNAGNIRTLMESLPGWQTLVPDTSSLLVTGGRGTHASAFLSGGGGGQYEVSTSDSYVTASRGPDSGSGASLAVIYMSHATTITIDQTKMASGYTATWVDPVTCATSTATVGSTYNSTAKGNNSRGEADWVLVLQGPSGSTGTASAAGAGSVTAKATVIAPATAAGAGSVADVATEAAPGTAAGAATATGKATQAATATGAGAAATTAAAAEIAPAAATGAAAAAAGATQAVTATAAAAGTVTALAAQIAGAAAAGASAVSDVATQIAGATAAGAGSVTAVGSVSGVSSGTASIAGAAAVAALATQITPAAATAAGQATAAATQGATAAAASAGSATALATQIATGTAAGAGTAAPVPATQIVTASITGAGSVTAAGNVIGAGATASAAAAATAGPAPATQIAPAAAAGAGATAAAATQAAGGTAAGAAAVADVAVQIAGAAAAAAASVTAAGSISGQSTAAAAAAASVTAVAAQAAPAAAAAAAAVTAAATRPATATAAAAASVTAAGYITGTASVAGAGTATAKGAQAAFATASGAGTATALATQRATATIAAAGSATAAATSTAPVTYGTARQAAMTIPAAISGDATATAARAAAGQMALARAQGGQYP